MGIEPSERNPGDPHKRVFNYPTFWRLFFYTGITQADTIWISTLMIALFFAGVFLFPERLTIPGAVLMLSIIFSPASMLLYERGNVDLIVFFLCVVIVIAGSYSAYAAAALLILGTVIKLFPFFGVSIFLEEKKPKFLLLFTACLLALLVYMYITWDSISASWDLTMRGKDISYGANVFFHRYDPAFSEILSHWSSDSLVDGVLKIGPIILALLLALAAGAAGLRNGVPLTTSSERNLTAFRMGASMYIGTFLLGNNWDYRLAFLILVMPQLLEWATPRARGSHRVVSVLTLIAIFVNCWHFIVWYSSSLANIKEFLFVFDEFFNWMLVVGLSYLLGASMPDWVKEESSFLSLRTTSVPIAQINMDAPPMISLRRAIPSEANVLTEIALSAKAYWGYPQRWMKIWAPQLTFSSEYFEENESWVAVDVDKPVAFYTIQEKNGNAWIENLWVLPECIGQGIGKQMFLHAVGLARQRGFKTLQLEADPNAAGFYEKMGMYKIGERRSDVDGQPRSLPIMEMTL